MNWKSFWNLKAENTSTLAQVARIKEGKTLEESLLTQIVFKIRSQLDLKTSDDVLDVCCGNGLITQQLSPYCKNMVGIDFSENQIESAKQFSSQPNIQYLTGDAATFQMDQKFDKIVLYFSFQYFESYELGKAVIKNLLSHLKKDGIILLGDIPDRKRINLYYLTLIKRLKYWIKFYLGHSDMGKFWSKTELDQICKELKVNGEFFNQEDWQPYSVYRFDYVVTFMREK